MYLGQGKCVSSFLSDSVIKFIGPLKTCRVPGINVDVMEVTLPGLRPPSWRGIGPLFTSGPDGSPPHTIDWVGDVLWRRRCYVVSCIVWVRVIWY